MWCSALRAGAPRRQRGRPTRPGAGAPGHTADVAPRSSGGPGRRVTRGCVASRTVRTGSASTGRASSLLRRRAEED